MLHIYGTFRQLLKKWQDGRKLKPRAPALLYVHPDVYMTTILRVGEANYTLL